jgi:hypothetical protein
VYTHRGGNGRKRLGDVSGRPPRIRNRLDQGKCGAYGDRKSRGERFLNDTPPERHQGRVISRPLASSPGGPEHLRIARARPLRRLAFPQERGRGARPISDVDWRGTRSLGATRRSRLTGAAVSPGLSPAFSSL